MVTSTRLVSASKVLVDRMLRSTRKEEVFQVVTVAKQKVLALLILDYSRRIGVLQSFKQN